MYKFESSYTYCLQKGIQQFYIQMRRRYFSPSPKQTISTYKSRQQPKLRWAGSQVRLPGSFEIQWQNQQSVGQYTYYLKKQIGSGYSSKVYKASKLNDNKEYAAKIIDLKKYSSSNIQMLENQIQILKSLNHPNILKCCDVYKTDHQCFIFTEYCPHGDLLSHLAKKGKFNQQEAIQIVSDIINGYKYLCQHSIIHRDLKPANIIKSYNKWKIADFGFAIKSTSDIKTKYNVGTPLYMPPQALIQNLYSTKSDIFSIGIILYQLLTGCTPWQSRTQKDLIKKMGSIPFKIPQKLNISSQIKLLLESMCDVRSKRRMNKKQFLDLNLLKLKQGQQNPQQRNLVSQKSRQYFNSRVSCKSNEALPRLMRLVSSKSILDAQEDIQQRKKQQYNNEVMICQLHYCRFLYYMIRNQNSFLCEKKQVQKLGLIIFTHLLKLVKVLAEPNINLLKLEDWDRFKLSKKYLNTHITIKQYSLRYQRQYLSYLKLLDLNVLEEVNSLFPQISKIKILSVDFYNKVLRFLEPFIRLFNHNLGLKLIKLEGQINRDHIGQIQALKSLVKYYKLVQISVNKFEDYKYFEGNCNIKVNVDFRKSGATLQQYNELRKQIKNI